MMWILIIAIYVFQEQLSNTTYKGVVKHILAFTGLVILWFILNQTLDYTLGETTYESYRNFEIETVDNWDTEFYEGDGGKLFFGMLMAYLIIYWLIINILFTKDED